MQYCTQCGGKIVFEIPPDDNTPRHCCPDCGFIHYHNPKMVVGCIPEWEDQILFCRRNIEPQKGKWTLPAGYLEVGETTMEGARRETLEETRALVTDLEPYLLCDIPFIGQIYMMFRARLTKPVFQATPESSEVLLLKEQEIPWNEIAFKVVEKTLRYYIEDRSKGSFPFRVRQIQK